MVRLDIPQKMREWSLWALWWLLFGGAVLWLLVGSAAYWVKHGWLPPDASGWVQALGGVGTLLAVLGLALWEYRRSVRSVREAERAANYKRTRRLRVFIEHVRAYIKRAEDNRTRPSALAFHEHQMRSFQDMFNSLLLDEDELCRQQWLIELSHHLFEVERCFIPGRFERTCVDRSLASLAEKLSLTAH